MTYNVKYPQFVYAALGAEGLIKTIGDGACAGCGHPTNWAELNMRRVCSEECREGPTTIEVTE